jgi:carboxymethylenebutenolidase
MVGQWQELTVDGRTMDTFVASPDGIGPFPAMVVIQHATGVDRFIEETAQRFADEGYVAVAPNLYHRQDPNSGESGSERRQKLLDKEVIADVNAAVEYINVTASTNDRIGIIGFCMGGRVAYLMPAVNAAFKAGVACYGGNTKAAWGEGGRTPFDLLAEVACPILGFFGEDDGNPSPQDMKEMDERLTQHGKEHEFHSYPGTGHAYMDYTNEQFYREAAAKASWPIALDFLARQLRG